MITNGEGPKGRPQLVELAVTILKSAITVAELEHNLEYGEEVKGAKPDASTMYAGIGSATASIMDAMSDLQIITAGPENYLKSLSYSYHDISAMSVILEYDVPSHVPETGTISFTDLAAACGCPAQRLQRIMRLLIVRRIFVEPEPEFVAHSATSRVLAKNKELAAFLGHCTHEAFPAASRLKDSMRAWPDTEAPHETGFNLAFGTQDPLFTYLSKDSVRFDRFNLGMAGISQAGGRSGLQVVNGFEWASIGAGKVVDIGGGNGHIAVALAEAYPELEFVVQDLEQALRAGTMELPASVDGRVTFQAHDMFEPQPVHDADVYYMRHILHDWPDEWAVKILKQIVPAMKPGARILISDSVIPPAGHMGTMEEKFVRYLDMQMMVLHNSRERTEEDFIELLRRADTRLEYQKTWRRGESVAASTMVEAIFKPEIATVEA